MAEAIPETIDKATTAVKVAANPSVLVTIFALVALAGCCFLVWRDEVRADAQISVLQLMEKRLGGVETEQRAQHAAFVAAGIRLKAAPSVVRDSE